MGQLNTLIVHTDFYTLHEMYKSFIDLVLGKNLSIEFIGRGTISKTQEF